MNEIEILEIQAQERGRIADQLFHAGQLHVSDWDTRFIINKIVDAILDNDIDKVEW